jgi:hypothetical protein
MKITYLSNDSAELGRRDKSCTEGMNYKRSYAIQRLQNMSDLLRQ